MINRQLLQMASWASLGLFGLSALERRIPRKSYSSTVPTDARHWHNPADPVQAARIEAAAAKRERKARKLAVNTGRATFHNHAHGIHCIAVAWKQSLNPTYVAK